MKKSTSKESIDENFWDIKSLDSNSDDSNADTNESTSMNKHSEQSESSDNLADEVYELNWEDNESEEHVNVGHKQCMVNKQEELVNEEEELVNDAEEKVNDEGEVNDEVGKSYIDDEEIVKDEVLNVEEEKVNIKEEDLICEKQIPVNDENKLLINNAKETINNIEEAVNNVEEDIIKTEELFDEKLVLPDNKGEDNDKEGINEGASYVDKTCDEIFYNHKNEVLIHDEMEDIDYNFGDNNFDDNNKIEENVDDLFSIAKTDCNQFTTNVREDDGADNTINVNTEEDCISADENDTDCVTNDEEAVNELNLQSLESNNICKETINFNETTNSDYNTNSNDFNDMIDFRGADIFDCEYTFDDSKSASCEFYNAEQPFQESTEIDAKNTYKSKLIDLLNGEDETEENNMLDAIPEEKEELDRYILNELENENYNEDTRNDSLNEYVRCELDKQMECKDRNDDVTNGNMNSINVERWDDKELEVVNNGSELVLKDTVVIDKDENNIDINTEDKIFFYNTDECVKEEKEQLIDGDRFISTNNEIINRKTSNECDSNIIQLTLDETPNQINELEEKEDLWSDEEVDFMNGNVKDLYFNINTNFIIENKVNTDMIDNSECLFEMNTENTLEDESRTLDDALETKDVNVEDKQKNISNSDMGEILGSKDENLEYEDDVFDGDVPEETWGNDNNDFILFSNRENTTDSQMINTDVQENIKFNVKTINENIKENKVTNVTISNDNTQNDIIIKEHINNQKNQEETEKQLVQETYKEPVKEKNIFNFIIPKTASQRNNITETKNVYKKKEKKFVQRPVFILIKNKLIVSYPVLQKRFDVKNRKESEFYKSVTVFYKTPDEVFYNQNKVGIDENIKSLNELIKVDEKSVNSIVDQKIIINILAKESNYNNDMYDNDLYNLFIDNEEYAITKSVEKRNWLLSLLFSASDEKLRERTVLYFLEQNYNAENIVYILIKLKYYDIALTKLVDLNANWKSYFIMALKNFNKDFTEELVRRIAKISIHNALYCIIVVKRVYNTDLNIHDLLINNLSAYKILVNLENGYGRITDLDILKHAHLNFVLNFNREDAYKEYVKVKSSLRKEFLIGFDEVFVDKKWGFMGFRKVVDRSIGKIMGVDIKDEVENVVEDKTINIVKDVIEDTNEGRDENEKVVPNIVAKQVGIIESNISHTQENTEEHVHKIGNMKVADNTQDSCNIIGETYESNKNTNLLSNKTEDAILKDDDENSGVVINIGQDTGKSFYKQKHYAQSFADFFITDDIPKENKSLDDTSMLLQSYLNNDEDTRNNVDKKSDKPKIKDETANKESGKKSSLFNLFGIFSKKKSYKVNIESEPEFVYDSETNKWISKGADVKPVYSQKEYKKEIVMPTMTKASSVQKKNDGGGLTSRYAGMKRANSGSKEVCDLIPGIKKGKKEASK